MNAVTFLGTAATIVLLMPALVILLLRIYNYAGTAALFSYYLLTAAANLFLQKLIVVKPALSTFTNTLCNFTDIPLMLIVLTLFANTMHKRKELERMLVLTVIYATIIALIYGWSHKSAMYVMGPGIIIVLWYAIQFFKQYTVLSIEKGKGTGQALLAAAIIFTYGSYGIIFYLTYVSKLVTPKDVMLIYHLTNLVSSLLVCIALIRLYYRKQELQEVQNTRRELALFFEH